MLLLVMMALIIIGAELFVLSRISCNMIFTSDSDYLQAQSRNITYSAIALAKYQIRNGKKFGDRETIEFALKGGGLSRADCELRIVSAEPGRVKIQVETFCSRGRRTFKDSNEYYISK